MSSGVPPLGKIVYVCDDVIEDPVSRKLNIHGAFDAARLPQWTEYPFTLPKMCVLAQVAGGRGTATFRAVVVAASTGNEIFGSPTYSFPMPGGHAIVTVLIRMLNCSFPHAGAYLVQLFCNDLFVDDRRLTLI